MQQGHYHNVQSETNYLLADINLVIDEYNVVFMLKACKCGMLTNKLYCGCDKAFTKTIQSTIFASTPKQQAN